MLDFEVFKERGARRQEKQPVVTIQKKGVLTLNPAAIEALGTPPAVELLFAPQARTIGIRAADPSLSHVYNLRQPSRSRTRIVAAAAFLRHYGIEADTTQRYLALMMGDILAVDLSQGEPDDDGDPAERRERR